jgi:hypothetical protein
MRWSSNHCAQLCSLLVLSVLSIALLGMERSSLYLQSPISPLLPEIVPGVLSPIPRATPIEQTPGRSSESPWSSPLPWVAVGVVMFGSLGWALIALLRRIESRDM